jgi:hypothetical protein
MSATPSKRASVLVALALACGLAAGCSGGAQLPALGGGPVSYSSSSVFKPTGYNDTRLDDTHFQVRASGDAKTPPARLEKMALVRAAEIGVEEKLDWFKVEGAETGLDCGKKVEGYKGPGTKPTPIRTLRLRVAYAKTQVDPTYQKADTTFASAKAELDADAATADAASEAELKQACGK